MKQEIFNLFQSKVTSLLDSIYHFRNEELPSFLLQNLFHRGCYLPFTSYSLKFRSLANVCNDIVINSRRNMLELGGGISTIIIARLMKVNKIDGKLISIDENENWIKILTEILKKEGINDYVEFVHLPTIRSDELQNSWEYDFERLKKTIGGEKFDLILIDGPKAYPKEKEFSRLSNLKIVSEFRKNNSIVFIDNADRKGEKELVKEICKLFDSKKVRISNSFIAIYAEQNFSFLL